MTPKLPTEKAESLSSCVWGPTDSPWWLRSETSLLRLPSNSTGGALPGLGAVPHLPAPHQGRNSAASLDPTEFLSGLRQSYTVSYQLPMASATSNRKLSGLKHKYIVLQFWRSEIWHRSHWAEIRVLGGLHSFWSVLRWIILFCLFQLPEATHIPWLMAPFHLQNQQWPVESPYPVTLMLTLCLPLPSFKDPCDDIGPTWIIQAHLPI